MAGAEKKRLIAIYDELLKYYGPRRWWPADSDFEVIVGAILTQNTNWRNVSKAIDNLKKEGLLTIRRLSAVKTDRLEKLIRPAGYFRIKAQRLKEFLNFLNRGYKGNLKKLFDKPLKILRQELLEVKGIGPETADSIILYAAKKPIFVVDAYTKRIFSRHKLLDEKSDYNSVQSIFMRNLPGSVKLFNEYHALIVQLGKDVCRKQPKCAICPIKEKNVWNH